MPKNFPVVVPNSYDWNDQWREGMPGRALQATDTGTWGPGVVIRGYSPTPTQCLRVYRIGIWTSVPGTFTVSCNGALLGYTFRNLTLATTTANPTDKVEFTGLVLPEGCSINVISRDTFTGTIDTWVEAYRGTADYNYGAAEVCQCLGDSISNTIGATYLEGFYHGALINYLKSQGVSIRMFNKGNGGFTTTNMEYMRASAQLNANQSNLITYMLGTNDTNLAIFQANFNAFIAWKILIYPDSPCICIGSPQYVANSVQEAAIATFRDYMQTTVAAQLAKYKFYFISFGPPLLLPNTTDFNSDLIHPNAAGQLKMGTALISFYQTNNIAV